MDNITKIKFEEWQNETHDDGKLWAGHYGQVLQVEGLTLPDGHLEVHFSLTKYTGDAHPYIGTVKDNVITVDIPDFIFQKENIYDAESYEAYAFIYQTDENSGQTIKKITFTIKARPNVTTNVPEDQKDAFLDEVRKVMAETKEIAQSVREDADAGKFNGKDGESGTVKIDEEQLLQFAIKQTTEKAEFLNIQDSAAYKILDFGMEGKTEQDTVAGNQLFDKDSVSIKQGLLQSNGTAIANVNYCYTDYIAILPNTTYAAKVFNTGINITGMWFYDENKTFISKSEATSYITSPETCVYIVYGFSKSVVAEITNDDLQTLSDSFMLVQSSTAPTTYEPYTGAQPSPNPDYPQEIKNAGVYNEETGRYEHKCCVGNKNLWDAEYARDVNNWDKTLEWYPCIKIYVGKGNKVSISYKQTLSTGLGMYCALSKYGTFNNYYWIYNTNSGGSNRYTLTAVDDYVFVCLNDPNGKLDTFMQYIGNDLQIEISDAQTDYTPHASQPFTLTSPEPLTKWDKLIKRDGVWGWSVWSGITDDFASLFTVAAIYGAVGSRYMAGCIMKDANINYRANNVYSEVGTQSASGRNLYQPSRSESNMNVPVDDDDTIESAKEHLHYKVQWLTSTEQAFHPLPDNEQTLLNNLETYYGVTNLYNEQGCPMWIKYVADTKLYMDKKLLEIQSAMI